MRTKQVVVIGAYDDIDNLEEAFQIGSHIAKNNWILITGGGSGIMEAVSKGAASLEGTVIGILPGSDISGANKYCSIVIPTGIGYARNIINILAADIIVAIGGKSGTLSELSYAWMYNKPVICCTFAEGWSKQLPETIIDDRIGSEIFTASTVKDTCSYLDSYLK